MDNIENSTDENYLFKTKTCKRLSKILDISDIVYDDTGEYNQPKEYGLSNCNIIIPSYYKIHENPSKITDIDYFEIIKDDIRNCRALNKYQLDYIKQLKDEYKNELFDIFNNCIKVLNDIVNDSL